MRHNLLVDPIPQTLRQLAYPMMLGIVSIMLFNIVDTFYIGQLGAKELTALSFTFPVVLTIMSLSHGLGLGTSATVARAIGQGDRDQVQQLTLHGLLLAFCLVMLVSLLGLFTIEPLFKLLGAESELLPLIREYMQIWYPAVGFIVIPMVGNSAIRATGDTRTPSRIMLVAAGTNILLDPLLIFGMGPFPRLEITGAALATLLSYSLTLAASLWVLIRRERMLVIRWYGWASLWQSWRQILHIGLPAAGVQMLLPLTTAILTRLLSSFGNAAVAAFGVGTRLESLATIGILAMASVLVPFLGQNAGAQLMERVRDGFRYSIRFSLLWGIAAWLLLLSLSPYIAVVFTEDLATQELIQQFLWWVPLSYGALGVLQQASATCNALRRPWRSTTLAVVRLCGLVLPLAWLGAYWQGVQGVWWGIVLGNLCSGLLAWWWIRGIHQTEPAQHYQ